MSQSSEQQPEEHTFAHSTAHNIAHCSVEKRRTTETPDNHLSSAQDSEVRNSWAREPMQIERNVSVNTRGDLGTGQLDQTNDEARIRNGQGILAHDQTAGSDPAEEAAVGAVARQHAGASPRDMRDNDPADDEQETLGELDAEDDKANNERAQRGHNSAQRRRLNQACLLCRRKKIRCDSTHPSCSNCQRRAIHCIYPEVRKRGRPPRMYTFADFAVPGQPLPPELQGLANVHASAMLSGNAAPGSMPAQGSTAASDTNGVTATRNKSPVLPPLSVAVARSVGDPMMAPPPPLGVDQAVLNLFESVTPGFPVVHRQTLVQHIRDRSLSLPLWLAIHALSAHFGAHSAQRPGAAYAEKAHAMLISRVGSRPPWARGGSAKDMSRRDLIELLQALVLLSIYYSGSGDMELATETHAAAVRIAQRMGVHLMDDCAVLQDASAIFNPAAAQRQRRRARSKPSPSTNDVGADTLHSARPASNPVAADLRQDWIELETLRRLWWSMFVLDRMFNLCAGCPRMLHASSFRVRLPCNDLEWDAMHAQPTTASPPTPAASSSSQPSGLMVRTFREAVMHTSLSEQAAGEIAATPSADPNAYRHVAALAGLIDSLVDLGDDIRALASAPMLEGAEIWNQLRADLDSSALSGGYGSTTAHSAYSRYGLVPHASSASAGRRDIPGSGAKLTAASIWLGSRESRSHFVRSSRGGWHCPSVASAWPPDWRSRMRVLRERAAALESQFTEWYSSMPIAQLARKPYQYAQLPLQDRVTYFHHQIVYYSCVIQLQSLVIMTQGLLLPDAINDEIVQPEYLGTQSAGASANIGPSALTNILWRMLMGVGNVAGDGAEQRGSGGTGDSNSDLHYAPRRRHFGMHSAWSAHRSYSTLGEVLGADDMDHHGSVDEDYASPTPLDEGGDSPEIIREELQRMVYAAWRRCTDAAIAMSAAVRRTNEARRVPSANANAPYYDPTFRPQVLPPYRADASQEHKKSTHYADNSSLFSASSRFERASLAGEMHASPHQPPQVVASNQASLNSSHRPLMGRRESGPADYPHYQPLHRQQPARSQHIGLATGSSQDTFADLTDPSMPAVDDATFCTRFNMFTSSAAHIGACIHLYNLALVPRWEESVRCQSDAMAKTSEMRRLHVGGAVQALGPSDAAMPVCTPNSADSGMLPDTQDIGALPPQLPLPPCTQEQAREGIRPLLKTLESMSSYWQVSAYITRIHSMWRDIEDKDHLPVHTMSLSPRRLSTQTLTPTSHPVAVPASPISLAAQRHGLRGHTRQISSPHPHPQSYLPQHGYVSMAHEHPLHHTHHQPPPPPLPQEQYSVHRAPNTIPHGHQSPDAGQPLPSLSSYQHTTMPPPLHPPPRP
ncbi:hypothetical protein H4R24_003254 [Coemansia sp. RSA 988]|nr:hypothetical protein H4R24_003254 [Coemansia sp. RSA 988]